MLDISSTSSRRNVGGLLFVPSRPAQVPCLPLSSLSLSSSRVVRITPALSLCSPSLSTTPYAWWNASFDELVDEDAEHDFEDSFCLEDDLFLAKSSSSSTLFSRFTALLENDCSSACSTPDDPTT
ncbi:hypothetical protein JCM8547_002786 [Rhodosporidiobolus lusitaniae]